MKGREHGAESKEQNCRAGASRADPWNGKRERLPYKSVIRHQRSQVRHGEIRPLADRRSVIIWEPEAKPVQLSVIV